jgi:hypothetical protein
VTNVIVSFCEAGEEATQAKIAEVNAYFPTDESCSGGQLVDVSDHAGGTKYLECTVLLGAFNYLTVSAFVSHVRSLSFEFPDDVNLFIRRQDDDGFHDWYREDPLGVEL